MLPAEHPGHPLRGGLHAQPGQLAPRGAHGARRNLHCAGWTVSGANRVYVWSRDVPEYAPRMKAISAYVFLLMDITLPLALVPKN